ncbi:MAG: hypothetical protein IIB06_03145 [Bacteroidetes bacterium]|nr:hypothetical protein [Bacteroidota bacterium]
MSDREIQEAMLTNQRIITGKTRSMSGWITFIGILIILGVIGQIIYLTSQAQ